MNTIILKSIRQVNAAWGVNAEVKTEAIQQILRASEIAGYNISSRRYDTINQIVLDIIAMENAAGSLYTTKLELDDAFASN